MRTRFRLGVGRAPRAGGARAPDLEQSVRRALAARAAMVRPEPDLDDLNRRIARDRAGARRAPLAVAAAALVAAAAGGAAIGSYLGPGATAHAYLSSDGGNDGGALPSAAAPSGGRTGGRTAAGSHGPRGGEPAGSSATPRRVLVAPPTIARMAGSGTSVLAVASWLPAVTVSGASSSGCYGAEIVRTTVSQGATTAGATGVAGLQPLSPGGLEVVDSGTVPEGAGRSIWWATLAVGSAVARVAAEQPDGTQDAMVPVGGLAVVAGVVPSDETSRYFSVVAEGSSGRSLHSIGFLAGLGSRVVGAARGEAGQDSATAGCARGLSLSGAHLSQPGAPLLAAAAVIASFAQTYAPGEVLRGRLAGVAGSGRLLAAVKAARSSVGADQPAIAGRQAGARSEPGSSTLGSSPGGVEVTEVAFVSARRAEVVYRLGGGQARTGSAVLSARGWLVTAATLCADTTGTDGPALGPGALVAACASGG